MNLSGNFALSSDAWLDTLSILPMSSNIETHLTEKRVFKPSKAFAKRARISSIAEYEKRYARSIKKPDKFWAEEAEELTWREPWTQSTPVEGP